MTGIVGVRELLAHQAERTFVGRQDELATLLGAVESARPPVTFVHGIGGIGKSRLLEVFSTHARVRHAFVVTLDCRRIEPTPSGFMRELSSAVGGDLGSVQEAAERLAEIPQRVILVLDSYEVVRLLDTWLRQDFVPALPATVHTVLCGREAPVAAWLSSPGWGRLFRTIELEPLAEAEAIQLLVLGGLSETQARQINRFTRGHPLALTLAAALTVQHRTELEALAFHQVIEELARMYLAEVPDEATRQALEAASVVRCATISLLRAMLPAAVPQDLYERIRVLPFIHQERDGLQVHDSVQQAIALSLKAADPTKYRSYRGAAWSQLRTDRAAAGVVAVHGGYAVPSRESLRAGGLFSDGGARVCARTRAARG